MITLNSEQREAVGRMHDFLAEPDKTMFMLKGSAGTGKTTCIQHLLRERGDDGTAALTAPTNKAAKVLAEMSRRAGLQNVPCMTIYSLLGLRVDNNHEVIRVEARGQSQAERFTLVVVDEASMVGASLFKHIEAASFAEPDIKWIFMGDPLQLPPVSEAESPTMAIQDGFYLSKVERHDNQILALATELRGAILNHQKPNFRSASDDKGGVYCVDYRRMVAQAQRAYTSDSYATQQGTIKTIAWRNEQVRSYNSLIRSAIYGEEADRSAFVVGERVVATHPVPLLDDLNKPAMMTDEEANVVKIEVGHHPTVPEIECYLMWLELERESPWVLAAVVHENSQKQYQALLDSAARRAKERKIPWSSFWSLKNQLFHDIRPCHAITAHRSQGSTYESVFVDVKDILCNRNETEAMRCLYTACTRPSRVLVLQTR